MDSVLHERIPPAAVLTEVLVVASGCTDRTEARVQDACARDPRVRMIREPVRRGKSSAINLLLRQFQGDVLVLVNADAELVSGALGHLLAAFTEDPAAEVACGSVTVRDGGTGLHSVLERLQWRVHNRTLAALSALGAGNHCCDEFMAVRRGFLTAVPPGLVNDGAYVGVVASLGGQSVRFRPEAEVLVETPSTVRGLVQQRVRVLRGHLQILRLLGRPPNTIEGLAIQRPGLAFRLLREVFGDDPLALLAFMALAVPVELYSILIAAWQEAKGDRLDAAWTPVE